MMSSGDPGLQRAPQFSYTPENMQLLGKVNDKTYRECIATVIYSKF